MRVFGILIGVLLTAILVCTLSGCDQGGKGNAAPQAKVPPGVTPSLPAEGSIDLQGSLGRFQVPGKVETDLSDAVVAVPAETQVVLGDRKSRLKSRFPTGGTAEVRGKARLTLHTNGFFTDDGSFVSVFQGEQRKLLQVQIPTAILGIKGTTIAFQLNAGTGLIELMEGKVEVKPLTGSAFAMKAGDVLVVEPTGVRIRDSGPATPGSGGTGKGPGKDQTGPGSLDDGQIHFDDPQKR
ncbi:MAG: cupin domain-containing protein [Candidatus Riflebacteria bacterium]|nr:cupin domain-containing protein [Candidatus Riflebacteria bacterium]